MDVTRKPATGPTRAVLSAAREYYAFDDRQDYEDAARGLLADLPDGGLIRDEEGNVVWDLPSLRATAWASDKSPDTVHPSQWRQAQLMSRGGLFEVVPGIYQVRNHDIANVTFVEADDSVVVIDTGNNTPCAAAAKQLYYAHRPHKPIRTVIYTHTHADHFGGILGLVTRDDVASGKVRIFAPGEDFERLALAENVQAGTVMGRRAGYFFGELLPPNERGFVTCGIGTALSSGAPGYISPTDIITETGQSVTIGGITFEFQYAPDTEAPEEMHVWIPEYKALTCAENANHSLHNIQTLRGARTRDAANFAHYLDEALERYGDHVEVHFGMHTWPVWGNERVRGFLESQRDTYKFIHDQALRLANLGYRPIEIAERLQLPESLDKAWWNRGYHGTLNHNLKAVFAKELGWFSGNPANLYPEPERVTAPKYVELMGGADAVVAAARAAFDEGNYRWVAQLLDHVVTADPTHEDAKVLQADAYEQLGYQSEGPQWRNAFLTAAQELREGVDRATPQAAPGIDLILGMPLQLLFDYAAVGLDGPTAASHPASINLEIDGIDGDHSMQVRNGVLHYWPKSLPRPDATLHLGHATLALAIFQPTAFSSLVESGKVIIDGDAAAVTAVWSLFTVFDAFFNILTPVERDTGN